MSKFDKFNEFRQTALNNANDIAKHVKNSMKNVSKSGMFIAKMFNRALTTVCGLLKGVISITSSGVALLIVLVLLISTYGVVAVVISGELDFILKGEMNNLETDDLGLTPEDGDLYYMAVCNAIDIDKICKYYQGNTGGFQDWYKNNYYIGMSTNENPAKLIDLFMLADEVYNRPEINNDTYEFGNEKAIVLGDFMYECDSCNKDLGSGGRLWTSEISYNCNSSGYCDPFGNNPRTFIKDTAISEHDTVGCTFISKYEKEGIADDHRAIYGTLKAMQNGDAAYITQNTLLKSTMSPLSMSDDAPSYISTIKLNHEVKGVSEWDSTTRGFPTYIPDAFYTLAYEFRVYNNGYNYGTHNQTDEFDSGGNYKGMQKLKESINIDKQQAGTILNMLAMGKRHYSARPDCLPDCPTFEGVDSETCDGESACFTLMFYLEGILDEIANSYNGSFKSLNGKHFATVLLEKLFGQLNGVDIGGITEDSPYMKVYDMLDHCTTKYKYPEDYKTCYMRFKEDWADITERALFYGGANEKHRRLIYGITTYIAGQILLNGTRRLIQACYDYQDSSGKYVFRLKNVTSQVQEIINSQLDESKLPPLTPNDPAYSDKSLISNNQVIEYACRWACGIAANDNIGYSMNTRNSGHEYDCSSLVFHSFVMAGWDKFKPGHVETSHYADKYFLEDGLFEMIYDGRKHPHYGTSAKQPWIKNGADLEFCDRLQLQRGDIFWICYDDLGSCGHIELYLGDKKNVGAHDNFDGRNGDSSGKEVNVQNCNTHVWAGIFRYKGPTDLTPADTTSKYYLGALGQYP